jgi:hypothetical protein
MPRLAQRFARHIPGMVTGTAGRRWRAGSLALALVVSFSLAPSARAAPTPADARAFFERFVAAQNAHDAAAVRAMLWDSPEMLWYTRGTEIRGPSAVVETLHGYYAGTWHLEPDMAKFHATVISEKVLQLLVPVVFTRGDTGQPPQKNEFLISQTLVLGPAGWQVASILPIANTQLKASQ